MRRLVEVGASHNRWHVGRVLKRLFAHIDDDSKALVAAEALQEDPDHADWYLHYVGDLNGLRPPLVRAINEMRARATE